MAHILLDACMPQWLRHEFAGHQVETAHFAGLDQLPDTQLIDRIEGRYDVLITLDRNIAFQQNLSNLGISVIVVRVSDQTPEQFRALVPQIGSVLDNLTIGEVREVG